MATERGFFSAERKPILIASTSALLLTIGLTLEFLIKWQEPALILFLIATIISGYDIAKTGLIALLFQRNLSINFLITVAAIGSFLIGHEEEGGTVTVLFYIALLLEGYATKRATRSIRALFELAPETATVKRESREVTIPVEGVRVGETVVVRPGEKIPLDGVITRGTSSVNQAPITGESMPVSKEAGDEVYAGTINNEGYLEIGVVKEAGETVLSKIIRMVREAQRMKSPTERFIDRFAKYYTPAVVVIATGVATLPPLLFGLPFNEWAYKAMTLLVLSCPCALAISTPVAMVSSLTSAARNGVLIRGGAYVEEISKSKVFALDKTGTLTEGRPEVTDVISFDNPGENVLAVAASIEAMSEHPLGKAIVRRAEEEGVELLPVEEFTAIAGRGIVGEISGKAYRICSRGLCSELSIDYPEEEVERLEGEGKTVVIVVREGKAVGLIGLMDRVRDATVDAVMKLRNRGVRTEMITGDNERTAKAFAERIGVDGYHAELLPEDKVKMVEELMQRHGHVVMVGDGVNDAPALARASVGIAMGAIGSDVSLETADIALMEDDLSKLPYLIELSKKTLRIIKENILASILVKGSVAILAFPGITTLWLAVVVGDLGLALAVIFNAMRLSLIRPK